jgi:hypothetical protein
MMARTVGFRVKTRMLWRYPMQPFTASHAIFAAIKPWPLRACDPIPL